MPVYGIGQRRTTYRRFFAAHIPDEIEREFLVAAEMSAVFALVVGVKVYNSFFALVYIRAVIFIESPYIKFSVARPAFYFALRAEYEQRSAGALRRTKHSVRRGRAVIELH